MLTRLKLFLLSTLLTLFSFDAIGDDEHERELRAFAKSPQWQRLIHFKRSPVTPNFYLTKLTSKDFLHNELLKTIDKLKSYPEAACQFPARYTILKQQFPNKISEGKLKDCHELQDWIGEIGHDSISIIYASAYPNNPASMFGHTLLRFSKKERPELLDYVVAFLAAVDPNDSPPVYTWRGITGGYLGYFEIEKFSQSIGLYNNAESRDLWEYKIPLNQHQRLILTYHLWELIQDVGFKYYFFNQNCSTLLLSLLEVAAPEWTLTEGLPFFVLPMETLKYIHNQSEGLELINLRRSLQSQLEYNISKLTQTEKNLFIQMKSNVRELKDNSENKKLLNLLIDYWHIQNYRAQTNLPAPQKELMNTTLSLRAKHGQSKSKNHKKDDVYISEAQINVSPLYSHNPRRISVGHRKNNISASASMGLHRLDDPPNGHHEFAYIEYLGIETSYNYKSDSFEIDQITVIDITSLEQFTTTFPRQSWNISSHWSKKGHFWMKNKSRHNLNGAVGISRQTHNLIATLFIGAQMLTTTSNFKSYISPYTSAQILLFMNSEQTLFSQINYTEYMTNNTSFAETELKLGHHINLNASLVLDYNISKRHRQKKDKELGLSLVYRF